MPHPPTSRPPARYRGRFAPTPSGPLHLGSLLTATASYLEAQVHHGQWLIRIDDLDRARCIPGADAEILRQLDQHGLHWDETPRYQHRHEEAYHAALTALQHQDLLYACQCTRAQLQHSSLSGPDGPVYAGTCRALRLPAQGRALRLRVPPGCQHFIDGWLGPQSRDLQRQIGDFTLRRTDGVIGYQLACSVDEHQQGITEVVRGADLLGSTFRQLQVMSALGHLPPRYRHLPILLDARGMKLSKQNHADPLDARQPGANLLRCLHWLGQQPPAELHSASPQEVLSWGATHWRSEAVATVQRPTLEAMP